jgi:uncharacterized protein DUF5947
VNGALERAVARAGSRRQSATQRCDVCAAPLPDQHRHLLDEQSGGLACACRACFLVLERQPGSGGRYRPIPDRRIRLRPEPIDVDVPVGLVFFVRGRDGRVVAHYPSPLGDTQAEVDERVARALNERAGPDGLRPGVEAVLVRANSRAGPDEQWLVPIDDCYRLVATIRQHWTGMSGGGAVWTAVARFFDDLAHSRHKEQ